MSLSTARNLCDEILVHVENLRGNSDRVDQESKFGVYQPSGQTPVDAIANLTIQVRELVTTPTEERAEEVLAYDNNGAYWLLNLYPLTATPEALVRQQGAALRQALAEAYPGLDVAEEACRGNLLVYITGNFQRRMIPAELLTELYDSEE